LNLRGNDVDSCDLLCMTSTSHPRTKEGKKLTGNGMLDLNTGIDLNEVMSAHLIDQKLSRSGIPVPNTLCQLHGIGQNRVSDLLGQMSGGCDLDDFLVPSLHGTVALKEVDRVALRVSEDLHLDVARAFQESFDEHRSIAKRRLGFTHGAFKRVLELGGFANDAHAAAATAHGSFDDNCMKKKQGSDAKRTQHPSFGKKKKKGLTWKPIFLNERFSVLE
jgi:hypothetical protein